MASQLDWKKITALGLICFLFVGLVIFSGCLEEEEVDGGGSSGGDSDKPGSVEKICEAEGYDYDTNKGGCYLLFGIKYVGRIGWSFILSLLIISLTTYWIFHYGLEKIHPSGEKNNLVAAVLAIVGGLGTAAYTIASGVYFWDFSAMFFYILSGVFGVVMLFKVIQTEGWTWRQKTMLAGGIIFVIGLLLLFTGVDSSWFNTLLIWLMIGGAITFIIGAIAAWIQYRRDHPGDEGSGPTPPGEPPEEPPETPPGPTPPGTPPPTDEINRLLQQVARLINQLAVLDRRIDELIRLYRRTP